MHIGDTPLIRLERVVPDNGVEIWVKWEGANPTGSMKDRMALSMILGAERRGQLRPGGRVLDYTGGSTGSSLAMVPGATCVAGEPINSQVLAGHKPTGAHRIEGTGAGFVPAIYKADLADAVMAVTDADAFATARRLAREEGLFGGISSGANVWMALERAKHLPAGARIVTTVCDSGLKYLKGDLYR